MNLSKPAAVAVIAAAAVLAAAPDLFAQAVGTVGAIAPQRNPDTIVPGTLIAEAIKPIVETVAFLIASVVLTIGGACLKSRFGIDVEKAHRDALQAAVTNGAGLVLAKFGPQIPDVNVKSVALAEGIEYVLRAAPDAINHFGLTKEGLAEKVVARVGVIAAPNTSVPAASPA